jgi:hypothetical protein
MGRRENPKVKPVIILTVERGGGKDGNPLRVVRQIFTLDGIFLGEDDPMICEICKKTGIIEMHCTSDHK